MKDIYLKTVARLKTVPALKWIDAEDGQLEFFEQRPAVAFPCALIDVEYPQCSDVDEDGTEQMVMARITVRLAFEPIGQTNANAPTAVQTKALSRYDTVNACFAALQGWGDSEVSGFSRKSQTTERRDDNLKVIRQVWETSFTEEA